MQKPSIIPNQPKEKPLIDVEGKIRNIANSQQSGSEGMELRSKPLNVKEEPIVGDVQLERHEMLREKSRKASFLFGRVTP
jgi:hypothetical protein